MEKKEQLLRGEAELDKLRQELNGLKLRFTFFHFFNFHIFWSSNGDNAAKRETAERALDSEKIRSKMCEAELDAAKKDLANIVKSLEHVEHQLEAAKSKEVRHILQYSDFNYKF